MPRKKKAKKALSSKAKPKAKAKAVPKKKKKKVTQKKAIKKKTANKSKTTPKKKAVKKKKIPKKPSFEESIVTINKEIIKRMYKVIEKDFNIVMRIYGPKLSYYDNKNTLPVASILPMK